MSKGAVKGEVVMEMLRTLIMNLPLSPGAPAGNILSGTAVSNLHVLADSLTTVVTVVAGVAKTWAKKIEAQKKTSTPIGARKCNFPRC